MSKVPFKSLKIITFTAGRATQARRTDPIREQTIHKCVESEADDYPQRN